MLDIAEVDNGFEVKFQYKPWLVTAIKQFPGARFIGAQKHWFIPASSGDALLNWAKTFGSGVKRVATVEVGEIEPLPELDMPVPEYIYNREKKAKGEPYEVMPYQTRGVAYNLQHKTVIVGDQPGLGKTVQAILTAILGGSKCILIICPATLRENWKREWKLWADKNAMVMTDRVKNTWPQYYKVGMCNVFICNYESLKKYFVESIAEFIDEKTGKKKPLRINHITFKENISFFDTVIIDEVHRCKDGRTQQAKFVMGIAKGKEWILGLTGTPVVNKPIDLIPQLHIIGRLYEFGGYKGFVDRYCQGFSEASNLKELNYLLHKHCFYRREKKEVLKDLPDKMRNIVRVDITNRAEYAKAENQFIEYLKENLGKTDGEIDRSLRGEIMVQMQILKKVAARGKKEAFIDAVKEVVDAGEKIILFAWHKDIVHDLKESIPGAVTVVGDDTMESRQRSVDAFQNDPKIQVIICNIKSGGVGITLTASSRVSFIELPWTPADCDQFEDRAHRIGQKDSVSANYFLGQDTIDEYIYQIIEKKRNIANQVTGAEDIIETNIVDEFINLFTKEKL